MNATTARLYVCLLGHTLMFTKRRGLHCPACDVAKPKEKKA